MLVVDRSVLQAPGFAHAAMWVKCRRCSAEITPREFHEDTDFARGLVWAAAARLGVVRLIPQRRGTLRAWYCSDACADADAR